ncbi:3137_t:CDS:2, partial [Racocetra fulgida]
MNLIKIVLTSYIEVFDQKANEYNKYAICLACLEIKRCPYALEKQFTNTKKCCKDHFKKCKFFKQKYGENESQAIIDDTDSEATIQKNTIALFEFVNPSYNLPKWRKLSNKILTHVLNSMIADIKVKAKEDSYSVTLAMDSWTNVINQSIIESTLITSSGKVLVWQAANISDERACTEEVKNKINEIIKTVIHEEIKIAAIVIDSHLSYAAARKQLQTLVAQYEPQNDIDEELIENNEDNLVLP